MIPSLPLMPHRSPDSPLRYRRCFHLHVAAVIDWPASCHLTPYPVPLTQHAGSVPDPFDRPINPRMQSKVGWPAHVPTNRRDNHVHTKDNNKTHVIALVV